ncbi:NUDIX domain-containing protein [Ectothiorhodospiraceae bacterium 2226]|nr:NUDIX domain-containing protein [Ectothiorhodospiraceae bacterium 2226]
MNGGERSAGLIVVRRGPRGWEFLLLRAYRNWDFPKGRIEPGEGPLAAARREIREETGLGNLHQPWGTGFIETPPYARGKVARYYLAEAPPDARVHLPVNPELGHPEHHEWRWCPPEEAGPLLVPRLRRVLNWAQEQLAGSES